MNSSGMDSKAQAFFFRSGGREIFAQLSEPQGAAQLREGLIICSPLPHEVKKTHWTMRQIAQRAQQAGFTTLRFDYFGSGDSEGPSSAFDLLSAQENIADAISFLKNSGLVRRITLLALRLSCPLALEVLKHERIKRLILIDPILDGAQYLAQLKALHGQFVRGNPFEAPFAAEEERTRQLLGFPFDLLLDLQLRSILPSVSEIKAKSLQIIQSAGMPSLESWAHSLGSQSQTEVHLRVVSDLLHWDRVEALSIQDFPNELINAAVEAVRGQV